MRTHPTRTRTLRRIPACTLAIVLAPTIACTADVGIHDVVATLDPNIADVVHVTWTTDTPTVGAVEFGTDTGYGQASPTESEATTEHSATMLGLYANSDYHFRVLGTPEGGQVQEGDDAVVSTGNLHAEVPDVEIVTPFSHADLQSLILTSTISLDYTGDLFVFDAEGNVVWYWIPVYGETSARPLADGSGVYYIDGTPWTDENTTLTIVQYDGASTSVPCPYCHHDVVEMPDGTFTTVRTSRQSVDGLQVGGDQLVNVAADGTTTVIWDAFDHLTVEENSSWDSGQVTGASDWTHANGIAYDPASDSFLVSLFGPETVVSIQNSTGATNWVLGGPDNQFDGGEDIGWNHAPEFAAGGVRLFNNAHLTTGSMLVEWSVDTTEMTASRAWSWASDSLYYSPVLGDVHRYDDGWALSAWGLSGQIIEVDDAENMAGEAYVAHSNGEPGVLGQVTPIASLYP